MLVIKKFIAFAKNNFSEKSYSRIKEALHIAIKLSEDSLRYSNDPMVHHAINVALIISKEVKLGAVSTISALLHDVVRSNKFSLEQVRSQFGENCMEVLKGMNDISQVETKEQIEQVEHFQELIVSYSTNPRIILLKLADRLEVMRNLHYFPEVKRTKKSWETINIYSQIAHKLGLYTIKSEMEDISLGFLEPEMYSHIQGKLETTAEARKNFTTQFVAPITDRLQKDNLNFSVKVRTKSVYSIWRKMSSKNISFEEIYDIFAIRIIADCELEKEKSICWHIYSVVTDFNKPNPDRMRDWISIPKSNGYESLHATVVTNSGEWVEVQIRTRRMDEVAEQGIAAHWKYKGIGDSGNAVWLQQLRAVMEEVSAGVGQVGGMEKPAINSEKEVFVFTPNGDLRKMPMGSTILDFAFDIHSGLGCKCIGGKINHKNVTLREELRNGDLVEIITAKNQKPNAGWLDIVITQKARSKIKLELREEESKRSNLGREELERKVKNWKLNITIDEAITLLTRYYKYKTGKEFLNVLADEKIAMADIKEQLVRHIAGENILRTTDERAPKERQYQESKGDFLIIDKDQKGIDYKLAKCCNPIYGDDIFSFVTVMKGITIHRSDCVNAASMRDRYSYRILPARWDQNQKGGAFIAKISISSDDAVGLEPSIRDVCKELKVNLRGMNLSYGDTVSGVITLEVNSISHIDIIIYKLQRIKGVRRVMRA